MTESVDWTTHFPRLAGVEPDTRDELLDQSQIADIPKGVVLFRNGDPAERYLLVISGSVAVTRRNREGQEIVLYRVETGESCILTTSCLMAGEHYPAESITESPTRAVIISKQLFEKALARCPVFRSFVMTAYGERVAELITLVEQLSFDPVNIRLAEYLLRHEKNGLLNETHQDIARSIGSAREVVSRQLKRFEKDGLIRLHRGQVEIVSADELRNVTRAM